MTSSRFYFMAGCKSITLPRRKCFALTPTFGNNSCCHCHNSFSERHLPCEGRLFILHGSGQLRVCSILWPPLQLDCACAAVAVFHNYQLGVLWSSASLLK
jgi:hypothetical protein